MPSYDYKCRNCGHRFELFTSISRRDSAVCPKCGGEVSRVYEGKWTALIKGGASQGGCSCGKGGCAGCQGCAGRG